MKKCISAENLKAMNSYALEKRRRGRCLLIVEGKHEKDELFLLLFQCFPELNIDINDVWIYGTNIYQLYEDIVKEYGHEWTNDDIDLPFVISKKKHLESLYYRNDFTDIFLVFDYERHDPQFSTEKILKMQKYFESSTDMGKLYLNYPMIEAYLHLKSLPDNAYVNRTIPVSLQPGEQYKRLVNLESCIRRQVHFPHRIDNLLAGEKYQIFEDDIRCQCCEAILEISTPEIENELEKILHVIEDDKKEKTLKYQLKDWILKVGYTREKMSYWKYMRQVFQQVVRQNIYKANHIQEIENVETLKTQFENIDLLEILNIQNRVSQNKDTGFIWVLSTCVFLIPDYNYQLVIE